MNAGVIYKQRIILSLKKGQKTPFVGSIFFQKMTKTAFIIIRQL